MTLKQSIQLNITDSDTNLLQVEAYGENNFFKVRPELKKLE